MTVGEQFLHYCGIPLSYPGWNELALDVDSAIFDAAEEIVTEWKLRDPLLRAMADERATLWTWATVPAGALPVGAVFEFHRCRGRLRQPNKNERAWYPDRLGVDWIEVEGTYHPEVKADTEVNAQVPVPFDLSVLVESA